jgi:anti-sigma regulatory factor (Ser/Thr protein kinase)
LEWQTQLRLPAESIAPALARAGIRPITDGLPERTAADVALLTSEIVSNAVQHVSGTPGDEIIVRIGGDEVIRVEVVDCGVLFDPPVPRQPWDARSNGWGLYLVDSVARAWGVESEGPGKKVWFELDPGSD